MNRNMRKLELTGLLSLLDKDDKKLLATLNCRSFGFERYLEERCYDRLQELEIVVQVLAKVCQIPGHNPHVLRILRIVKNNDPFLINDVPSVIHKCLTETHDFPLVKYAANYMIILKKLLKLFAFSQVVRTAFPVMQNYMNHMKELKLRNLDFANQQFQHLKVAVDSYEHSEDEAEDVNAVQNFRKLSVVPRSDDVINCETPTLPINIVEGSYKNVEHYLSVHYRLMREDMLRTFRSCIGVCLNRNRNSDKNEMVTNSGRIYDDVQVRLPPTYTDDGIWYSVKVICPFPVNWTKTKSLMPGNLVCLTPDNFNTVVFVTVKEQKIGSSCCSVCDLKVVIEDDLYKDELNDKHTYVMIETNAYFESYRHVLSAIKGLSEKNFPLADVIAYLDYEDSFPEYLENEPFCLHEHNDCQVEGQDEKSHPCKTFDVLNFDDWPTAEQLKLDDHQLQAFQTALTKKVAVIQGPPGTGKTHIGIKIVKALLDNVPLKPILISCVTNHALDQFLANILQHTRKIIRLGSQSKSKILEPHKIGNLMSAVCDFRTDGENCFESMNNVAKTSVGIAKLLAKDILLCAPKMYYDEQKRKLKEICNDLNENLDLLSLCEEKYIHDTALNEIIDLDFKKQLRKGSSSSSHALSRSVFEWLHVSRGDDLYEQCKKKWQKMPQNNLGSFSDDSESDCGISRKLWAISLCERYALFYNWRKKCLKILNHRIKDGKEEYKKLMAGHTKYVSHDKLELLRGADVIGVTTTGASKYKDLIKFVNPAIIIIEEAAEVLESHIIATLVPSVKHLILIGDHEQLRPLPTNHDLATKYKLNISMFERLFKNNAPSATLVSQHRMRPCIADLLVPKIYKCLTSHESVYHYEDIKGVKSNVFFFEHSEPEDKNSSSKSSSNAFEAEFIASLAKYFMAQGYEDSKITILVTYAAQLPLIHRNLDEKCSAIYVTTVDNYQGEENDIILLSFVRSNVTGIGFLKESNRICVALSRAKKGMFCIGNFKLFEEKSSHWRAITDKLRASNMIGADFPLQCHRHGNINYVRNGENVLEFISEGCNEKCDFMLPCGHVCERSCHFDDVDHVQYLCEKPCERFIDDMRICRRLCYKPCKKMKKAAFMLKCGHYSTGNVNGIDSIFDSFKCEVEVPHRLPCGHDDKLPCHVDVKSHRCRALIPVNLHCGHKRKVPCYQTLSHDVVICHEMSARIGPCGHTIEIPCNLDLDNSDILPYCTMSCDALLNCGHACVGYCFWCFDIGIHALCRVKCELRLSCGHICQGFCGSPCPPCSKKCQLICPHHNACINSCIRTCIECLKPCVRNCGHVTCTNPCFMKCSVDPCNVPCREVLSCGHSCIGLCGETCPFLCRICNLEDLHSKNPQCDRFIMLDECNHVFEVNELNNHVQNCIISFEWPSCPTCSHIIRKSARYKNELLEAKELCLKSNDTSDELADCFYLLHNMYGKDYLVPSRFRDVHRKMLEILEHEKPTTSALTVFKTCIMSLKKLIKIHEKLEGAYDERVESRLETLLLWIYNHLQEASFQQLEELGISVREIENNKFLLWS